MNRLYLGFLVVAMALTTACKNQDFNTGRDISVNWEMISNQADTVPAALAAFTFINHSDHDWCDTNWVFYFNQSPRNILRYFCEQPVSIQRISGDWYSIKPGAGFSLKSGQSLRLEYFVEAWWIKHSDAPTGAYWVVKNKSQESILKADVDIAPFLRPEQISRFKNDREPLPSSAFDFGKYQSLRELPENEIPPVVPFPASFDQKEGYSVMGPEIIVQAPEELKNEKELLSEWLQNHTELKIIDNQQSADKRFVISLLLKPAFTGKGKEAYRLLIDENQVVIESATPAGIYYGCQTFQGLLPVDSLLKKSSLYRIPCIEIRDHPRFAYRGMHIDVARNFIPLNNLLKIIDLLSFYKINTLHLHLTDDEGWRIEIPSLPELTQIGAHRKHTSKSGAELHPSYGSGPQSNGGYFTRKDFVKLLKYAAQRHITVVPEINLPGHARAAIKAMEARYHRLLEKGDTMAAEAFRLIDPLDNSHYLSAQYYDDNVVCVVSEQVYNFMDIVIRELVEQYAEAGLKPVMVHTGGDEVPQGAWTGSPRVTEWLKKHPDYRIADLQEYYLKRVKDILSKYGIRVAGWEEIALKNENGRRVVNTTFTGGDVVPFVWNNLWGAQDLGYRLANRNYPVVLCHVTSLYFDLSYSKDPTEPGLYWAGFVDEYKTWFYNPLNVFQTTRRDEMGRDIQPEVEYTHMERLKPLAEKNILGLQAQLWTETVKNPSMAEYYLLPKLISFAQVAWGPARRWETAQSLSVNEKLLQEDWNVFANALGQREIPRLAILYGGFSYRIPTPGIKTEGNMLKVAVPLPGTVVRYAPAGENLTSGSPILAPGATLLRKHRLQLATFDKAGHHSKIIVIE